MVKKPAKRPADAVIIRPEGTKAGLLKVQLQCWPPPTDLSQAVRLHRQLIKQLDKVLDPRRLQSPSTGYKPRGVTAQGDGPNCWLDSTTIRSCVIGGVEQMCRVDLFMCDDGSWYEREYPAEGQGLQDDGTTNADS